MLRTTCGRRSHKPTLSHSLRSHVSGIRSTAVRWHHATRILKESQSNNKQVETETDRAYPTKRSTLENYQPEEIKERKLPEYESPYSGPREAYNNSALVDDAELWWQDAMQKEKIYDEYLPEMSRGKALLTFLFALLLIAVFFLMFMWKVPVVDHAAQPLPPQEVYEQLDPAMQHEVRRTAAEDKERLYTQRTEGKLGVSPREVYDQVVKPRVEYIKNLFKEENE